VGELHAVVVVDDVDVVLVVVDVVEVVVLVVVLLVLVEVVDVVVVVVTQGTVTTWQVSRPSNPGLEQKQGELQPDDTTDQVSPFHFRLHDAAHAPVVVVLVVVVVVGQP
jgi:hypothetical protein